MSSSPAHRSANRPRTAPRPLPVGPVFRVKVRAGEDPFCARVILKSHWSGDVAAARDCLKEALRHWPRGVKTKYLITPGGYLRFPCPPELGNRPDPNAARLDPRLKDAAADRLRLMLTPALLRSLRARTRFLTIGVDAYDQLYTRAELVALIDLSRPPIPRWTGKSYPLAFQEKILFREPRLESHFFRLAGESVCILGCHDLNLFSPRSRGLTETTQRQTLKKKLIRDFAELVREKKPTVVLHHPHTTPFVKTWCTALGGMKTGYSHIRKFAGAGRYYDEGKRRKSPLEEVIGTTKIGEILDFLTTSSRRRGGNTVVAR